MSQARSHITVAEALEILGRARARMLRHPRRRSWAVQHLGRRYVVKTDCLGARICADNVELVRVYGAD